METLFLDGTKDLHPFGKGGSFSCFTDGKRVIKFTKAGSSEAKAYEKYHQISGEYQLLKKYLGGYVLESEISLEERQDGWVVGIGQDFVSGTPLRKSLSSKNPLIHDFFDKSLSMYKDTGLVPDLLPDIMWDPSLGIYLTGKYTYRSGVNVLMVDEQPKLIDVAFTRWIRRKVAGFVVRSLVARKLSSLLKETV